jgi:Uma2 family endonuclease
MELSRSRFVLRFDPATGIGICPSRDEDAHLTPAERDEITERIRVSVGGWQETQPAEGTAHERAIRGTLDRVERHFKRRGRGLFLASNLLIEYPEEPGFAPDLVAVVDVPVGEERTSWHVEREGRGIDLALEVLFNGDQKKDLRGNVERYARLGIPEYFVFDGKRSRISAWRLPPGQERYAPIVPQSGAYPSQVLGVEFAVVEGRLRVFQDGLEVASAEDEIGRLGRLVDERERTLAAEAERATAEAERATAEAERATASLIAARTLLERLLRVRGFEVTADVRARIERCDDPERLTRWADRALEANSAADAID